MITKWKVGNFKSIREETELDLGPLTIFAGANSSGKSTFIQSILLVAQTLAHKVGSRSVVLNSTLTSLGQFDDLKSNGGVSDQITIKCTCRPFGDQNAVIERRSQLASRGVGYYGWRPEQLQEIGCEISFDADASGAQRDLSQIQPRLFASQLSCIFKDKDNVDKKAYISIHHSPKAISEIEGVNGVSEIDDQLRASLAYSVELDDDSAAKMKKFLKKFFYGSAKPVGCMFRHFLPERIVYAINTIEENANKITWGLQNRTPITMAMDEDPSPLSKAIYKEFCDLDFQHIREDNETVLSERIIAVLREVLKGTIDFDQTFKDQYRQDSRFDSNVLTLKSWYKSIPDEKLSEVLKVLRERKDLFDRIHQIMKESMAGKPGIRFDSVELSFFLDMITEAVEYLDTFFTSSLKYLGPLRNAPKPLYPLTPAVDLYNVGLRGENTASILELHKNKKICYIPSVNFKEPVVDPQIDTQTLEKAVIDWLQYLGVASSVESRDRGKLGHELKVQLADSDSPHDLTHVGVGVSQVLPILVMCLLAKEDSTLIFEQPELHLHPKVQSLLGDFFLSMALCNKQCIVETHSEYLIDRLRFRIAAATPGNELNNQTKIYFVEKPSQVSIFREVVINEYGAISDWPEGFFDQSQQQAEDILCAAAIKRKANRRNKDA